MWYNTHVIKRDYKITRPGDKGRRKLYDICRGNGKGLQRRTLNVAARLHQPQDEHRKPTGKHSRRHPKRRGIYLGSLVAQHVILLQALPYSPEHFYQIAQMAGLRARNAAARSKARANANIASPALRAEGVFLYFNPRALGGRDCVFLGFFITLFDFCSYFICRWRLFCITLILFPCGISLYRGYLFCFCYYLFFSYVLVAFYFGVSLS